MGNNRYSQLIERIFFDNYIKGSKRVEFIRADIEKAAKKLRINLPKNLGDVIYSVFQLLLNLCKMGKLLYSHLKQIRLR
ncbi:MAG: hypothetical protein D4R67_05390 [Bacteroidetes bacterium]|nr:MAG: hypothetical protein D4R67_05390 [Bacteroidota bacterium]